MIGTDEYKRIVSELLDELPDAFFRELTGGVIVSQAAPRPDYARGDDLCIMGLYRVFSGVRQIILPQDAGLFTESRADPAGEFRKVICFQKPCQSLRHMSFIYFMIPFRDQIVQRTAGDHTAQFHG